MNVVDSGRSTGQPVRTYRPLRGGSPARRRRATPALWSAVNRSATLSLAGGGAVAAAAAVLTVVATPRSSRAAELVDGSGTSSSAWVSTITWNTTSGVNAGYYPGVPSKSANTGGTTTDIADFNGSTATSIGINMGTVGNLSLGAIQLLAGAKNNVTIGDSSATAGNLILNGTAVPGVSGATNVILDNFSPTYGLTIAPNTSSSYAVMNLSLGSATSTVFADTGATVSISTSVLQASGVTAGIVKQGAGTLFLTGPSFTYSGGLNVSGGTVSYFSGAALGVVPSSFNATDVVLNGGTLNYFSNGFGYTQGANQGFTLGPNGGTINVAYATSGTSYTLSEVIAGTGLLTKTGPGTLVLTAATNTYTGGTNISAGALSISNTFMLGGSNGANIYNGTLLYTGGSLSSGRTFSVNTASSAFNVSTSSAALALTGVVSGAGTLNKVGPGRLTLSGVNTYTGGTNLTSGSILATSSSALGGGPLNFSPVAGDTATIYFTGSAPSVSSLSATGGGTSSLNLGYTGSAGATTTLTVGSDNTSTTFAGTIADQVALQAGAIGRLTKVGNGSLTLTGNNTYTGVTTINAGTLVANSTTGSATGTAAVTVTGGTLAGGTTAAPGLVAGPVNLPAAGTITAGSGATPADTVGTLSTGNLNLSGGTYAVKLNGATAGANVAGSSDLLVLTGGLNASSTSLTVSPVGLTSGAGGFVNGTTYSFTIADIPAAALTAGSSTFSALSAITVNPSASAPAADVNGYTVADVMSGNDDTLVLSFTSAAPEPTSLLLAGLAATPLTLGRRRRARRTASAAV